MDNRVTALIKTCKGEKGIELTADERKKFDVLDLDFIKKQLDHLHPGEATAPLSLNPETNKLIYQDGPTRRTIELEKLGYVLDGDRYIKGKSIMRRRAEDIGID